MPDENTLYFGGQTMEEKRKCEREHFGAIK